MLNRLPRQVPCLDLILDDIGRPHARELAKVLDVSEQTVAKWIRKGDAPRPVLLALYWLTSWGMSAVDCEAHNSAVLHAAMAASLKTELARMSRKLAQMGRIADFGSANDPAHGVELPAVAPVLQPAPTDVPIRPRRKTA